MKISPILKFDAQWELPSKFSWQFSPPIVIGQFSLKTRLKTGTDFQPAGENRPTLVLTLTSWARLASFFKLGQHLTSPFPYFALYPCYNPHEHVRRVSSYKVLKTQQGWEQSETAVIFFCPKIDEICMILCKLYWMVNFVHPFLPPLNSVWTGVFLYHSYRCLLSTLEFSQSIKHGILVQSSVGRFSNAKPVLSSDSIPVLTMRTDWHF